MLMKSDGQTKSWNGRRKWRWNSRSRQLWSLRRESSCRNLERRRESLWREWHWKWGRWSIYCRCRERLFFLISVLFQDRCPEEAYWITNSEFQLLFMATSLYTITLLSSAAYQIWMIIIQDKLHVKFVLLIVFISWTMRNYRGTISALWEVLELVWERKTLITYIVYFRV